MRWWLWFGLASDICACNSGDSGCDGGGDGDGGGGGGDGGGVLH